MELSGRKTEQWERKNMKKKGRKAATSLGKKRREGGRGRARNREGRVEGGMGGGREGGGKTSC